MARRMRIAFGPATTHASWRWVGADLIPTISEYHDCAVFEGSLNMVPGGLDVLVAIKLLPGERELVGLKKLGVKIVYLPVDLHASPEHIAGHAAALHCCDAILLHSERLLP